MSTWTAVVVVVAGCAAVVALVRSDEERLAAPSGRNRSRLTAATWLLTGTAMAAALLRILLIY